MKILNYTIALFLLIGITTSCKDDDDDTINVSKDQVVGEWNVTEFESDGEESLSASGFTINTKSNGTGKDFMNAMLNMGSDNEITGSGNFTLATSIEVPGEEDQVEESEVDLSLMTGDWNVDGDKLTLNIAGEDNGTEVYTITSFSSSKMKLKSVVEEEGEEFGFEFKIKQTVYITLEK